MDQKDTHIEKIMICHALEIQESPVFPCSMLCIVV